MRPLFPITRYMPRLPIDYLKPFQWFQLPVTVPVTDVDHRLLSPDAERPQGWRPFPAMILQHLRSQAPFSSCNTRCPHNLPIPNGILTPFRHPGDLGKPSIYPRVAAILRQARSDYRESHCLVNGSDAGHRAFKKVIWPVKNQ
jgi:hypothetical protein